MREITVFYDNSSYTLTWLRALVWAKSEFKNVGYKIIFDSISSYIPKQQVIFPPMTTKEAFKKMLSKRRMDIVFLAYHHSHSGGLAVLKSEDRIEVLKNIRRNCNSIVWLDTADSTGTCIFDVMPYIDKYLKKQKLVDSEKYCYSIWGGRTHCEYYHKKFGIEDNFINEKLYQPLDKKYINKLGVSWNVGLGDLFTKRKIDKLIYRKKYAPITFTEPSSFRKFDIHYRGSTSPSIALYQRNKTIELLSKRNDISQPDVSKRVPYDEYVKETRNSRAIISPFGWGEICTRDIEAFVHGATMIKMDMSHLETYPNWYINNYTYLSIDWDFKNFNEIIDYTISEVGKKYIINIAKNGQNIFKQYMNEKEKKLEFVEHLLSQID